MLNNVTSYDIPLINWSHWNFDCRNLSVTISVISQVAGSNVMNIVDPLLTINAILSFFIHSTAIKWWSLSSVWILKCKYKLFARHGKL